MPRIRSTENVRSFLVLGHEREQVHPAGRVDQPVRLDHVLLLAAARHREVLHRRAAVVERRVEQPGDVLALGLDRVGAPGARRRPLGLDDERQAVEELAHAGRERGRQLVERRRHVLLERRRGEHFDQRAAEVERAQLREGEPGIVEAAERLRLERPVALAVVEFVEQREPGGLQRLEIAADRPRRDAGARGEVVDGEPARRFEVAQDRPLADDFGVARHSDLTRTPPSYCDSATAPGSSPRASPHRRRSRTPGCRYRPPTPSCSG